jgi:hypothetical protein
MGLVISLAACICSCICAANAQMELNEAERALGRAQRRLLEASMIAASAAEEPAEPDKPESMVELAFELPLVGGGLGMNTSGNTLGKGIIFRSFHMSSRLSQMGVLFDGCRIVAVRHETSVGGEKFPCANVELGDLSHPVALKVLGLHIDKVWAEKTKNGMLGITFAVVLVVGAPNALSAPMAQQPEPESIMPLEQSQAEASLVVLRSSSSSSFLNVTHPSFLEMISRKNAQEILRFQNSAHCVKIELAGTYFSIYGMGATFSSFVTYDRVRGAKKNDSNSYQESEFAWRSWLEGGLVFSGFSTPDCELARLGFLTEGCHLVGYGNGDSSFTPIKSFKEKYDWPVNYGLFSGGYLVFRNVVKEQAIEVVSA